VPILTTLSKLSVLVTTTFSFLSTRYYEDSRHVFHIPHTHTHLCNGPFSRTTWVSRYQKGKTNLDFAEARDSERQWHQLGHMQVCTYLQTDNRAHTPPLTFLHAGCPSCHPTNSVKTLKATNHHIPPIHTYYFTPG